MKTYYPGKYNPIHPVMDWRKVRRIMRAALRGDNIPPAIHDGGNWLTGTHRMAANDLLEKLGHERLIGEIHIDDVPEIIPAYIMDAIGAGDFCSVNDFFDRLNY